MQVSIQHSYTEIQPLPQAKEFYPVLMGLIRRVALVASVAFLNICAGATLGLTGIGISIWTGTVSGGVLGLLAGITMALLMKLPTNIESYRVDTLEQIRGVTSNPKAMEALESLKEFFYYPLTLISHNYDLHTLYRNLATVGDALDPSREDVQGVWKEFLNHLNVKTFKTPDGQTHIFNAASLLHRLSGNRLEVTSSWLSAWWPSSEDLDEVAKIGMESFGKESAFSAGKIKAAMAKYKPSQMRIVRNQANGHILGYGWYYTEGGVVRIAEIARRPESARLNIGSSILHDLIKAQRPGTPIQMVLRKENPFNHRMLGWKFHVVKELPNYFDKEPAEDGILMELDWPKYQEMISQLG